MVKKNVIIFSVLLVLAVVIPFGANAAGIVPCGGEGEERCTLCHLVIGIKNIIDYGFKILIFVALAAITISGVMYVVSSGSEELMKKAKDFIKQTLTGFAIVLGGWLIINYAMVLLGAKDSNGDGVPDFGFVSTGGWSNFTCDATPIAPGGASVNTPINAPVNSVPIITAKGCCIVSAGPPAHCSNGVSATECNGQFLDKLCAEVPGCAAVASGGCGNKKMGFCSQAGNWINVALSCPDGYTALIGGLSTDCPGASQKCCVANSQAGGMCGTDGGGTCKVESTNCTQLSPSDNYPKCTSGTKCCKK